MPKPMYVWSGSAWVSVATEVESLANYATVNYASTQPGMKMVVPTSVAVGSGSGSVDTNGAVTFTTASSISLNGCFTSAYDNYRIVINIKSAADCDIQLRLRASGTDNSSSNYAMGRVYVGVGVSVALGSGNNVTSTQTILGEASTNYSHQVVDIAYPYATQNTTIASTTVGRLLELIGCRTTVTTSYDGFTLINDASTTLTGTIRVYGYKN